MPAPPPKPPPSGAGAGAASKEENIYIPSFISKRPFYAGEEGDDAVRQELRQEVRHDIGALAAPEKIQFAPALPKTRSGKIMRRILRKIAEGATDGFGDTSTLADPTIVDALVAGRQ